MQFSPTPLLLPLRSRCSPQPPPSQSVFFS
jgi:hypothetical protein